MQEKFLEFINNYHIPKVILYMILFSLSCCATNFILGTKIISGDFIFAILTGIIIGILFEKDAQKK